MEHQRSVATRFSSAAATYGQHAVVQTEAARILADLVAKLTPSARILEIGCGTGILTAKLVRLLPDAVIHAIDVAPAMVAKAQERLAGAGRVFWVVGDIGSMRGERPYDMVVSNSSLHWVVPLSAVVKSAAQLLAPGGHFAFSIMIKGTLGELRAVRERIAPHKIPPWHLPTAEEVLDSLRESGLELLYEKRSSSRIEFPSAADFLRCIHDQGLTGGRFSNAGISLNRTELRKLVSGYNENYKSKRSGVFATYEVMYVVAAAEHLLVRCHPERSGA